MFGNTFVIPHADGNITCIKINQDKYSSEYMCRRTLDEVRVRIRHTTTKAKTVGLVTVPAVDRHNVEIVQTTYATVDTAEYSRKVYIVIEQKPDDLDVKLTDSLSDWLIASVNANVTSLLSWES